jgi:hypothetical protein
MSDSSARDIRGPSPLLAVDDEPPPRLIVDPPLPEPLTHGKVFIQYRTENLRVVPVFGTGALDVSPRIGHIHITVDDAGWHFVDASGETVILVGLQPGPHTASSWSSWCRATVGRSEWLRATRSRERRVRQIEHDEVDTRVETSGRWFVLRDP